MNNTHQLSTDSLNNNATRFIIVPVSGAGILVCWPARLTKHIPPDPCYPLNEKQTDGTLSFRKRKKKPMAYFQSWRYYYLKSPQVK
jgi:hypothetical protein